MNRRQTAFDDEFIPVWNNSLLALAYMPEQPELHAIRIRVAGNTIFYRSKDGGFSQLKSDAQSFAPFQIQQAIEYARVAASMRFGSEGVLNVSKVDYSELVREGVS